MGRALHQASVKIKRPPLPSLRLVSRCNQHLLRSGQATSSTLRSEQSPLTSVSYGSHSAMALHSQTRAMRSLILTLKRCATTTTTKKSCLSKIKKLLDSTAPPSHLEALIHMRQSSIWESTTNHVLIHASTQK